MLPPHYDIYRRIRDARPDSAILLYDKPAYDHDSTFERRRDMIRATYERALAEGDRGVFLVEAVEMFRGARVSECIADCSHPNDLGAMLIANAIFTEIEGFFAK